MTRQNTVITNYRKAWIDFRKSNEWERLTRIMNDKGIKPRYASNILQTAFAAGWGKKKIKQV